MLLTSIFYHVDNFCNDLDKNLMERSIESGKQRGPQMQLSQSEIMTIVIFFHHSSVRTFKDYYRIYIKGNLSSIIQKHLKLRWIWIFELNFCHPELDSGSIKLINSHNLRSHVSVWDWAYSWIYKKI